MAITQNDIIYFIITDRFYGVQNLNPDVQKKIDRSNPFFYHGGNIPGIIEKIPYLKKLGVTALWITPVYLQIDLPTVHGYHGYWALDFNQIDPQFYIDNGKYPKNSKLYLKDLTDELHKNGIKLILDMVVNHTGYGHPAKTNAEDNPTPIRSNWFNQEGLSCNIDEIQGELAALPDLDLDSHDVSDYHITTIIDWVRQTGIDAVRMDTVKHVEKKFWYDFKTQVKGVCNDLSLLGEVLVFDIGTLSDYQKYYDFDCLFDFPMQQAIRSVFIDDESFHLLYSPFERGHGILEKDHWYTNQNKLSTLLDNHDLSARYMTWAMGRHHNNKAPAVIVYNLSLTYMFTIRGIPQLYYGNEIGLEGGSDPDNRRDFPWEVFDDKYDVKSNYKFEKEIFDHTCHLIKIRKENAALTSGDLVCLYVDHFIFSYMRYVENNILIVVLHNGWMDMPEAVTINIDANNGIPERIKSQIRNKKINCQLTGKEIEIKSGAFSIQLSGKTGVILK